MICMSKGDIAKQNFMNGYNCSQAVLLAFCEDFGLEKETALKNINTLRNSIIYTTYIPQLIKFKSILKKEDVDTIKTYLKNIPWKNLIYVNFKNKIKLSILFFIHIFK